MARRLTASDHVDSDNPTLFGLRRKQDTVPGP